jgi:hypothetical protein
MQANLFGQPRVHLSLPIRVAEETLWITPQMRPDRWGCQ